MFGSERCERALVGADDKEEKRERAEMQSSLYTFGLSSAFTRYVVVHRL
jgi:hypothetical protein